MSKLPAKRQYVLTFFWIDGRGHRQKMAKGLAQKVGVTEKTIDQMVFLKASFSSSEFLLAAQVFRLIGRKPTTVIKIQGIPTVSKAALERVFGCYEASMRSRASKKYCLTEVVQTRSRHGSMEIGINVSTLGIHPTNTHVPRKRIKPLIYPCRICYYYTHDPIPDTREKWIENYDFVADQMHTLVCPKFKSI